MTSGRSYIIRRLVHLDFGRRSAGGGGVVQLGVSNLELREETTGRAAGGLRREALGGRGLETRMVEGRGDAFLLRLRRRAEFLARVALCTLKAALYAAWPRPLGAASGGKLEVSRPGSSSSTRVKSRSSRGGAHTAMVDGSVQGDAAAIAVWYHKVTTARAEPSPVSLKHQCVAAPLRRGQPIAAVFSVVRASGTIVRPGWCGCGFIPPPSPASHLQGHPLNFSGRISGKADNNRAELAAVFWALLCHPRAEPLTLYTDNTHVLGCMHSLAREGPENSRCLLVWGIALLLHLRVARTLLRKIKAHNQNEAHDTAGIAFAANSRENSSKTRIVVSAPVI